MNTKYEEIVDVNSIGTSNNPINLNDILIKAGEEKLEPATSNKYQN